MKKNPDTLEDLVVHLRCANTTLALLHDALEDGRQDTHCIMESLYATHLHIDRIIKEMNSQLSRIDLAVLRKAAEGVAE